MKTTVIFIYRLLTHMVIFIATFPLWLAGILLLGITLPITKTYVPKALRWFDCADFYIGRDTSTIQKVIASGVYNYWYFIAIRNPLNYFSYKVLGVDTTGCIVKQYNSEVGDNLRAGFCYYELLDFSGDVKAYEYYYVHKWSNTTCFRFRLGHKISGLGSGKIAQEVFVISPYRSYTGI